MKRITCFFIIAIILGLALHQGWCCDVPVFRYALERWPADNFRILLCHNGDLTAPEQVVADSLQQASFDETGFNFEVRQLDVAAIDKADLKLTVDGAEPPALPYLVIRYPRNINGGTIIETGPLTQEYVRSIVDSPARREIAKLILEGNTAVWAFLDSGDSSKDDAAYGKVQPQIEELKKIVSLPDSTDVTEADTIELDDPQNALRIDFSCIRISRDDPKERFLVEQLLCSEGDLKDYPEPMLFPIFGRGRILYALVGPGITNENMLEAAQFITGPCTCIVKDDNPGIDLLMSVNWDDALETRMVQDRAIPLPFGLYEVVADASGDASQVSNISKDIDLYSIDSPRKSKSLYRNLFIGAIVVLVINTIFLVTLIRKKRN